MEIRMPVMIPGSAARTQHLDNGIDEVPCDACRRHRGAEHDADRGADGEPEQDAPETDYGVEPQRRSLARVGPVDVVGKGLDRLRNRRQEDRVG
jgi:hypothetical protein